MHRGVVESHRWIGERAFMQALDVCMLLPGPEAMKLAIWLGWRLHGAPGGVLAGLCFIGPSIAILLALSFIYALHGDLPLVAASLAGLQATVIALIVQAHAFAALQWIRIDAHRVIAGGAALGLVPDFA
jgi:chromate transporter